MINTEKRVITFIIIVRWENKSHLFISTNECRMNPQLKRDPWRRAHYIGCSVKLWLIFKCHKLCCTFVMQDFSSRLSFPLSALHGVILSKKSVGH